MTSFDRYDAIIIGGGHNGLVCAAMLGKAGQRVLVLEAEDALGGAARTEEFFPGYKASTAHLLNRLHPDVVKALGLDVGAATPAPTALLSPDKPPIILHGAWGERIEGAISESEKANFAAMRAQLIRYAAILKPFLTRNPPDLHGMALTDKLAFGGAGLALKRLGNEDMRDFLRMMLMNVHDVADEHLTDDRLKGLLAFEAALGSHLGPRSPTSLLGLYYRLTGEAGGQTGAQIIPSGGMGSIVEAIANAARETGVEIRTSEPAARIVIEKGRVLGVETAASGLIVSSTVISAINPRTALLDLVGAPELDTGVVRKVKNIRMEGNVAKLHLALSALPEFPGLRAEALAGRLLIAPSADHVERAFNPAKYGEFSPEPVMEVTLPSVSDPSLAPAGGAVLSANVMYAPYRLKEGWDKGKAKFLKAIMTVLEAHAPGIGKLVQHAELLTPADIEQRYRMPGGHWHHGELQVDQMLLNRPFFGAEQYAAPVDGLWLASAGSHPGGGVSGAPGMNAARAVMRGRR